VLLQGNERVNVPLHLQVSSVSPAAQKLVEAAGGSVTRVYYTRLGLRALLKVGKRHKTAIASLYCLLLIHIFYRAHGSGVHFSCTAACFAARSDASSGTGI
jgi:hypothetical protein